MTFRNQPLTFSQNENFCKKWKILEKFSNSESFPILKKKNKF